MGELNSSHEKADTRIFVHVADMVHRGYSYITIRTTESDVVVIAVSVIQHLKSQRLRKLWLSYGTTASF